MSFQKAHNISNELAEVTLVQSVDIDSATAVYFPVPAVTNQNFRVLEVGWTANGTTAAGTTFRVETAVNGAQSQIIVDTSSIPIMAGPNVTTGALGQTISTSYSDVAVAAPLSFYETPAGGGTADTLDSDGVPRVLSGQAIRLVPVAHAGSGWLNVFIKLAPEVQYKD
jgi:phage tail sheath protein FI